MERIIVNLEDVTSPEFKENVKIPPTENRQAYLQFEKKEKGIKEQIKKILDAQKYPLLLEKIVEFRKKFPNEYSERELEELKDFFKPLKKVYELMEQGCHVELITTMIGSSTIGLGCQTDSELCNKFNKAWCDKELFEDFWGTKFDEVVDAVGVLLDDFEQGTDINNLAEENLLHSCLVAYCLAEDNKKEDAKTQQKFIAFCKE